MKSVSEHTDMGIQNHQKVILYEIKYGEGIAYLKSSDKLLTKQSKNSTNEILSILAAQRKANLPAV